MTSDPPLKPSNTTKQGFVDWDLGDSEDDQEDKLFHDDIGEDTVFGLDDYLAQQKQQKDEDVPVIGAFNGMELDSIDDEHLMYPQSPSPGPTAINNNNNNKRITMHDDEDDDIEMELFQWMDSMDNDGMDPELASLVNARNGGSSSSNNNRGDNNNNNNNMLSSSKLTLTKVDTSIQQQPQRDFSKPPETGGFLTASCPRTGKPIYFPLQLKASTTTTSTSSGWLKQKNIQLLTTPIRLMFEQLELEHKEKIHQAEREEQQHYRRKMKKKKQIQAESQALWVEKYRPSVFMDLLGDQRVNREALRWVKQWDYCVFGKKPQHESQRDKALRQYKATFGNAMGQQYEKKHDKQTNDNTIEKPKDTLLRPDRKILLLSGPPGFGKTTLAHVIGKQAGYNIVEVNASDDRTGEVVKTKIKSALEMQAILRNTDDTGDTTMYTKPNILIIDEIDGASAGGGSDSFIKQLVELASIEATSANDKSASSSSGGGFHSMTKKPANKKKKQQPLLRPIICICNDVYAPVLRPLRMIAHHIPFRKVPNLNVARRLQEISQSEGLDTDLRALSLLAEMTDGDLRSCLNTLQFIRSKSTVFNKEMLMESDGLGKKDMGRTLFSTWDELFTAAHSKNRSLFTRGPLTDRYVQRLATSISSTGDMEKLMQGCFEAYPLMKFHDQALSKVVQMGEWFDFYDHLSHRAHHLHDYSVYGYIPYTLVNFHRFFAGSVAQEHRMEYPKVDYEVFAKKKSYDNLIKIFLTGIHPGHRRFLSRDELVLNVVPRLLRILSPDLRPVNKQLIKPKEKETLDRLVNVMLDYGLTFMQHKTDEGQFSFSLEPPMEELIWFESVTQKSVLTSRYAVRQMVMQEIETERLRRRELTMGELYDKSKKKKDPSTLLTSKKSGTEEFKKAATDFFGRPLEPNETSSSEDKCMEEVDVVTVSYKYHEGFSNAVRKPMPVHLFF